MKLQDFLSTKAKCIKELDPRYFNSWDVGETYDISITIQVTDKNNDDICFEPQDFLDHFEPVLDEIDTTQNSVDLTNLSFKNPVMRYGELEKTQTAIESCLSAANTDDLHPEFEALPDKLEPKFKVGDKVYWGLRSRIFKTHRFMSANVLEVELDGGVTSVHKDELCPATQENYERLQATFPDIEFEAPPKPLTGSDLCRAMLEKGWNCVPCYISDESDYDADNNAFCALIGKFDKCFKELATNYEHEYAVPFDPRTGEPLTEAVLDE